MLKIRIIPTLLYKNLGLVKGVKFDSWRRVGSVMQSIKVYNMREVDELVFLDISATCEERSPDLQMVDEIADECFMPLAVGGGIKKLEDVRNLLKVGADKVVVGSALVTNPELVTQIANKFGSQCLVASIDVSQKNGKYEVFINSGKKATDIDPVKLALQAQKLGAGEIILTSIDRDGTMTGYDIELIKMVSSMIKIPLIVSGGAGNFDHMLSASKIEGVSGLAAASMFHFTQQTPLEAKRYLKENGVNVRL